MRNREKTIELTGIVKRFYIGKQMCIRDRNHDS